ncbi:hypothetical protein GCM10007063_09520 [Lentibacillus kapialis]|uniref:Uncharacterized protein n=1 Tax=Lentibacillus kapialis TaxID=340214 RepID=A0A917PRK4_9BACI|nr:hypothetical protein GCM10007063_09520 [Lentibacillus kapialis]
MYDLSLPFLYFGEVSYSLPGRAGAFVRGRRKLERERRKLERERHELVRKHHKSGPGQVFTNRK